MDCPPQPPQRSAGWRRGGGAACVAATPEIASAKRAEGDHHACRPDGASGRRWPARAAAGEACVAGRAQCLAAEGAGPVRRGFSHRHPTQGGRGGINSSVLACWRCLPAGHTRSEVSYRQGLPWLAARVVCGRPDGASRPEGATLLRRHRGRIAAYRHRDSAPR